jgi:DNA-directed RNA polymerase subunit M/transcription elongation factor TFIIS
MASSFKEKEKKVKKHNKKCYNNLLSIHNTKIKEFNDEIEQLETFKSEIFKIDSQINELESFLDKEISQIKELTELRDKKKELQDKINNIENYDNIMDYYFQTADIIDEYCTLELDPIKSKVNINDFFKVKKKSSKLSKKDLLDKYLDIIDDKYVVVKSEPSFSFCKDCNQDMVIEKQQGVYICLKCAQINAIPIDSETHKNSNSTISESAKYSVYERKNHFKEWLNQLQAKESTDIPSEIFDSILVELNKMRVTNLANIDATLIQKILKKLNFSKYYENIYHIMYRLNGIQPPTLTREMEDRLLGYFKQIEEPFRMYKKKNRKNLLRYSYVLYKLCELMELDEFLPCFKLLKNRNKLMEQDVIWQSICNHLGWEFYPSL